MKKRLGVGAIGVGTYGEWHVRAYAEYHKSKLVGIADINEEMGKQVAERYKVDHRYTNYEDLLRNPEVEAVSIALPDFLHEGACVKAAEAGKHVFVEKPLATTVEAGENIVNSAKEAGVKLGVDFANRWSPYYLDAKQAIDAGDVGEIKYIHFVINDTIFVPTQMINWADRSSVLWFLGSHAIDLIRWFTGKEIISVEAKAGYGELKGRGIDTPDFYLSTLELEGGTLAQVENCWILPESMPAVYDFRTEIVGTKGKLEINNSPGRTNCAHKYTKDGYTIPNFLIFGEVGGKLFGFGKEVITSFVDSVLDDQAPFATGEDGLVTTKVICALEEAAGSGRKVEVSD